MKKMTALLLALMMLAGVLAGCGKPKDAGKAGKLKVVTTIFPAYDWVRAILGDKAENAEITMLLDNGVDLHSYQPTADDIVKISDCDLFVYVGGESDGWVENALKNAANKNMKVINLLEGTTRINRCLEDNHKCSRNATATCPVRKFYVRVQTYLEEAFRDKTIASLLED